MPGRSMSSKVGTSTCADASGSQELCCVRCEQAIVRDLTICCVAQANDAGYEGFLPDNIVLSCKQRVGVSMMWFKVRQIRQSWKKPAPGKWPL